MASTIQNVTKSASKSRLAWIVGLVAAGAAAVGTVAYFATGKTANAATPPAPPGPAPANTPVWTQLTPVAGTAGNFVVNIPANATFALADNSSDPNLGAIVSGLSQAFNAGAVGAPTTYANGVAPPAGFPSDGFGSNGYRAVAVAKQAFALSLGPLTSTSPANAPAVWIVTGFTGA